MAPGHGHFVSIMEIILIRMGEGGAGVNVFWVDRTLSLFLSSVMTDLEVQCWRQWEGEGGLDCGLLPWVMVSDEQSPQCTVQTECCRGA